MQNTNRIITRLDNHINNSVRLTHSKEDVVSTLKLTNIINGKAIAEALEYRYYDNEAQTYKELAKVTNYTASALKQAYQAYKAEQLIRNEIACKQQEQQELIEAERQTKLQLAKTKREEAIANNEAKEKLSLEIKFNHETETKLSSLSDGAKRELGRGTTTKEGKTNPDKVALVVEVLQDLPTKATAKEIKQILNPTPTKDIQSLEQEIKSLKAQLKKEQALKAKRNKEIKLLKERVDLTPLKEAKAQLDEYWGLYTLVMRNWQDRVRKRHDKDNKERHDLTEKALKGANPLTALGLPSTATMEDIKARYRELAKIYHPDKPNGDEEKFKVISKAYNYIKKELKWS